MAKIYFIPKSHIKLINKEVFVIDGSLTIDVLNVDKTYGYLQVEFASEKHEQLYEFLKDFGTWDIVS